MADFASYRERETDIPQVINLDHVGQILISTNGASDIEGEIYIGFYSLDGPASASSISKRQTWYNKSNTELMKWRFSVTTCGFSIDVIMKICNKVVQAILKGKRSFTFYDMPEVTEDSDDDIMFA